jgi:glycosyltransferase involved in cell wall biosynthesis
MKRLVWICWKDIRHPEAGGAELVQQEISKRLVRDGWEVIHLVPGYKGCVPGETIEGIRVIRVGQSILSFYRLPFYFRRHLREGTTLVMDSFISLGSFACLLMKPAQAAMAIYHIEDVKWFYQNRFYGVPPWIMPFFQVTGYFVEKLQLVALACLFRGKVVTDSESTAGELVRHGFKRDRVHVIRMATTARALDSLEAAKSKQDGFTVMAIGMRKVKRPDHVLKAFELFQARCPDACLWLVGWGGMHDRLEADVKRRGIRNVTFSGRVTDGERDELLQRSHVLCAASIREGWGLVVIEANAMGTPVIAYDVPGLRDALSFENGWLAEPTPAGMADKMGEAYRMWLERRGEYEQLRARCLESARGFSFERTYEDFKEAVGEALFREGAPRMQEKK